MNNGVEIMQTDTIAAIATPTGTGGVAIIRISGQQALQVLHRVFCGTHEFEHAKLYYGSVRKNGELLDRVMAVMFYAPKSYTGEDTAELHCHGSAVGVKNVLEYVTQCGARPAQAGEFTKRAFLNGKMDLTQAEAVCDFISAVSAEGAKASMKQLEGTVKKLITEFQNQLTDMIAEVEAAVEYPEEDLEIPITQNIVPLLQNLRNQVSSLSKTFDKGRILKDGLDVTIAGKPNVGKSSLLNALLGINRAIVTDIAGTTRDTIEQSFEINGIAINMTDTAGIRSTDDIIENYGVERSKDAIKSSRLVIFVLDSLTDIDKNDHLIFKALKDAQVDFIVVLNKLDACESLSEQLYLDAFGEVDLIKISAKTQEGIENLKNRIFEYAAADEVNGVVITNLRHQYLLKKTAEHLNDAIVALQNGLDMDCITIDLNLAWSSLGEITGNTVSEEIIDRIFEKFCLGK
ncbi:MAG: tRNA uridine-5-carboxymethylaminomethyl(34) synthesis GTPase MnmE [Christensenellaceae bacterium]